MTHIACKDGIFKATENHIPIHVFNDVQFRFPASFESEGDILQVWQVKILQDTLHLMPDNQQTPLDPHEVKNP